MLINAHTRIADLIKHDKKSIDAIASLAKPLEKLKNPVLRKLMASRVTIAEAAKIGDCQLKDFARALRPLGFEFSNLKPEIARAEEPKPFWLSTLSSKTIEEFDVRGLLASSEDPLKQIIRRFKRIEVGHTLCVINAFIPTPLVRLLEKEGVKSYTEAAGDTEFRTYFFKESVQQKRGTSSSNRIFMDSQRRFAEVQALFSIEKIKKIDVRDLEMPLPMETILQELALLQKKSALHVVHKRIPIHLLEELANLEVEVHVLKLAESDVKLFIFHP